MSAQEAIRQLNPLLGNHADGRFDKEILYSGLSIERQLGNNYTVQGFIQFKYGRTRHIRPSAADYIERALTYLAPQILRKAMALAKEEVDAQENP